MRKSLLRLWPGFLAALCLIAGGGTIAAHASTPGSGTISWTSTSLDWSGSNLTGTAPAVTRLTCYSQTACDDYALTVDTKKGGSVDPHSLVEVKVAPSSGASMYVIVYPPGSDPSDPTNTDYNKVGLDWKAFNPANGKYTIRVVCQTCAAASYTAHATIVDSSAAAQLPPVGSGQFTVTARSGTATVDYGAGTVFDKQATGTLADVQTGSCVVVGEAAGSDPTTGSVDATTVRGALDELGRKYPAITQRLFENGQVRRFVNVYVNDEDVRYLDNLATAVKAGDEVSIIPAVAGG